MLESVAAISGEFWGINPGDVNWRPPGARARADPWTGSVPAVHLVHEKATMSIVITNLLSYYTASACHCMLQAASTIRYTDDQPINHALAAMDLNAMREPNRHFRAIVVHFWDYVVPL